MWTVDVFGVFIPPYGYGYLSSLPVNPVMEGYLMSIYLKNEYLINFS